MLVVFEATILDGVTLEATTLEAVETVRVLLEVFLEDTFGEAVD